MQQPRHNHTRAGQPSSAQNHPAPPGSMARRRWGHRQWNTHTVAFAIRLHCWLICFEINAKLIYTTHRQFIQPFAPTAVIHSSTHSHIQTGIHSFIQTCSQAYKIHVCLFLYSLRKQPGGWSDGRSVDAFWRCARSRPSASAPTVAADTYRSAN